VIGIALTLGSLTTIAGASVQAFLLGSPVSTLSPARGWTRLSSSDLDLDDGSR
jgi:hypothetical protein